METIKNLLDTAADMCGSADMARRVILIIGLLIILRCANKYFKTRHKIHIIVMCASLLACTSAACYYKPEKLPLMAPVVGLMLLLLYIVFSGKDTVSTRGQGEYAEAGRKR